MNLFVRNFSERVIRKANRITLFLLLIFGFTLNASGQNYYFDNYSVIEGLEQSKVYAVEQDDKGYVWLGTKSGISRFDGKDFENYQPSDGIAERAVRTIHKDQDGNVWFGHNAGSITVYDGQKFIIHPVSDSIDADISALVQDKSGRIWITTDGDGIYRIDRENQLDTALFTTHHYIGKEVGDRAFGVTVTYEGDLYFITAALIKKYDEESDSFKKFHPKGLDSFFQITSMHKDSRGDIWFGTYHGGLYHLKHESDSMVIYDSKRDGLAHNWISCISEDSRGDIWVGTFGGGISQFSDGEIITYNSENGLIDEKIHTIKEDVEGNILIGTNEHGLLIFKGGKFQTYGEDDGLSDKHIWAIHQDRKGRFWFGTNKGITVFENNPGDKESVFYFNEKENMIGDQIRYIKEDKDGNIWIGTNENKILQYLIDDQEFFYHPILNNALRQMKFNNLEVDNDNNLWIGAIDGILFYDIEKNEIDRISQEDGLAGNNITALYNDDQGRIWVGIQYMGITLIDDGNYSQIKTREEITPISILQDNDGTIWVGTNSKGVFQYKNDSLIQTYTMDTGLLSNHITLMNVDNNDNLFIGTNRGLNKITRDGDIYTYTKKSGFTGIESKENATFMDDDGNLWFGTVNGAIKYRPEKEKRKDLEPITHIESMLVNLKKRPLTEDLKLNYTENSLIFNYNSICLSNPDAVKYQIMLKGSDKHWRPITEQTMVNYSSLSPGDYTFILKARNDAGMWNKEPVTYSFVIKPPFYKTWWFIISVIAVGIIAIIVFIKVREQKLRKEKQILENKVAERTQEISMKNKELSKKNQDIMDSIRYAQRIQVAVLPPEVPFENTFVLFRPKDIVSGDFYWLESVDGKEFMAAVDCTGHGVPGAFLSILGHNLLTKIVKEYGIHETDDILDKLNSEVLDALHQSKVDGEKVVNDGMDLALICYDKNTNELSFSGAYNSLYFIRDGELQEYKANRFPIGRTTLVENKKFTGHKIKVKEGDTAYIFSDGYADQFGGDKGKKFKSRPLKRYLESIQDLNMEEQEKALEKNLLEWMGNYEQVDDIVFIGKRF